MPVTRFGLQIPSFTYPGVDGAALFERVADIATAAEESGFDSVWVMDHFYQIPMVGPRTDPMLEAYTLLGALAARTRRVSLGAMVTGVTYRNPALLAKQVTTLDIVSGGRAVLGIGAAWNDDEHRGYGFPFPAVGERMDRLEETLRITRAMFREEAPSFEGRHHTIHQALNQPRPLRPGGIPILVGGSGERRLLRLVAQYADACNLFGDVPTIRHKLDVLARHCEAVGRDPAEITKTRLGGLVIAATADEAERRGQAMRAARGMDEERYRGYVIAGDPDAVGEQVQAYLDAGLDGLVFNMADAHELEPVRLAGRTLSRVLG
ncbi:MAG TPA: LLM class F420-dependent oxidoreductase [Candidatus Dormibacteraeota bacterium]|nr:LLM class F420-dependent oxidoreductase [Candidatus Dormibacteraeota bacterium]